MANTTPRERALEDQILHLRRELADMRKLVPPAPIHVEWKGSKEELQALLSAKPQPIQEMGPGTDIYVAVASVVSKHGDPESFGERELKVTGDLSAIPYKTVLYAVMPFVAPALPR